MKPVLLNTPNEATGDYWITITDLSSKDNFIFWEHSNKKVLKRYSIKTKMYSKYYGCLRKTENIPI